MSSVNISNRQKVMDTALHMILENGIQSASMGKISKASGVAVGTIYHHFASKEELVSEIYRSLKLKMLEPFEKLEYQSNTKETFKLIMRTFINFALEHPEEFTFIEQFYMSPIVDPKVKREVQTSYYSCNTVIVEVLRKEGELKPLSDELLILFVNGSMMSAIRSHLSGELNLKSEDFESFIQMIWDGITR